MKQSTRIRRRTALSAVLHEQDRHQYEIATSNILFYDDTKIRDASRKNTRVSEDMAFVMEQCDHQVACNNDGGKNSGTTTPLKTSSSRYGNIIIPISASYHTDQNLFRRNATHTNDMKWKFHTKTTGGEQQQIHRQ